jgi:hypothetical protein
MDTQYTNKKVEQLQAAANEYIDLLNAYINERSRVDPDFQDVAELFLSDLDDDYSYDIFGEVITIQWRYYDRCGDSNYYQRTFPLSHLWDDSWKAQLEAKQEAKRQAEKEAKRLKAEQEAAREKRKQEALEINERLELQRLQAKYGAAV